jgi:hypothetical protein
MNFILLLTRALIRGQSPKDNDTMKKKTSASAPPLPPNPSSLPPNGKKRSDSTAPQQRPTAQQAAPKDGDATTLSKDSHPTVSVRDYSSCVLFLID